MIAEPTEESKVLYEIVLNIPNQLSATTVNIIVKKWRMSSLT